MCRRLFLVVQAFNDKLRVSAIVFLLFCYDLVNRLAVLTVFVEAQPPNELVKRLMVEQGVKVIRYQDRATNKPDKKALLRAAENGYILIKFTNTHVIDPPFFI